MKYIPLLLLYVPLHHFKAIISPILLSLRLDAFLLLPFFMTIFCSSLQKVVIEHLFRRTSLSLEKSEERKREGEREGGSKMKWVVLSLKVLVLTGTESPEKSNSLGL